MSEVKFELLVEVWRITEFRDGMIYKTEFDHEEWIDSDNRNNPPEGFCYAPLSSHDERLAIRVKKN